MQRSVVSILAFCCLAVPGMAGGLALGGDIGQLTSDLGSRDSNVRWKAADGLARMGPQAASAVPALIKAMGSSDLQLRWRAARAVGAMGPEAAAADEALVALLGDSDPLVREYAADSLGRIGVVNESVLEALGKAATDESPQVRAEAVGAINSFELEPSQRIALLVNVLNDAEPSVVAPALHTIAENAPEGSETLIKALKNPKSRYWGCLIAAEMGPRAKHAVSALSDAAQDEFPEVRMEALLALGAIGPDASSALPTINAALNDESGAVHYAAIYALGEIGDPSSANVIRPYLDSEDAMLAALSAWSLARVSPKDTAARNKAIKILVGALDNESAPVRAGAVRALAEFPGEASQFFPALITLLADENFTVVANTIETLTSFGEPVVPALIDALNDPERRMAAVTILQRLGPKAKAAAVPLVEVVGTSDDPAFRQETGFALAAIGPAASGATDKLLMLLDDEDPQVVYSAVYALGNIGPAAKNAVPKLSENLRSDDDFLQLSCTWALLKIQPNNTEIVVKSVPLLIEAISELQELGRIEAAIALGEIGAAAKSAIPALREAEGDPNPAVRNAASEALRKIGS